jgi:hypothetical protein
VLRVYRKSHHQIAKAAVPNAAATAVEISNESAANLIQSVTAHDFPVWLNFRVRYDGNLKCAPPVI